jgi:hypothetical protein
VPFAADTLVRSRFVRLADPTQGDDAPAAAPAGELRLGPVLRIAFFPDLVETFEQAGAATPNGRGGVVWIGRSDRGSVTLVVAGDRINGFAQIGPRSLGIDPVGGGLHRVGELDPRAERPDIVVEFPSPPARPAPAEEDALARRATSRIDVLVAYTPAAEKRSSDIRAEIDLAVSLANQAYAASGVGIELRAVETMLVDYEEGGNFRTDLDLLTEGKPPFRRVHAARDRSRADLVSLIRKGGAYCGIAHLVKRPSASTSDGAFSVVSRDCIPLNHSFAHELGHNMGLQHDRYWLKKATGETFPDQKFGFGFVNKGAAIRDVMGYNDLCAEDGVYCTRVNMFSTPRDTYDGSRIGIRKGKPGAADAARTLDRTREAIAGYR